MDKPTKVKTKPPAKPIQIEVSKGAKKQTISTTEGDWGHVTREVCSFFGLKEKSLKFWTCDGKRVDPRSFLLGNFFLIFLFLRFFF